MRIIAGTHRGRRFLPPRDASTTRPITDRVKQSLFDRLWSMGVLPTDPADPGPEPVRVLDIFCGTGSLGLEALSRGAGHCTFVDMDRDAINRLKTNLTDLALADRAEVVRVSALNPVWLSRMGTGSVGLIFLDPPYAMASDEKNKPVLIRLMESLTRVSAEDAVMVFRTPKYLDGPTVTGWDGPDSRTYGSMTLHFYQPAR